MKFVRVILIIICILIILLAVLCLIAELGGSTPDTVYALQGMV